MSREEDELRKLIRHYDERAEHYEYEYQMSGSPSQERAWARNQRMADALRAALNGRDQQDKLYTLHARIMELDAGDAESLRNNVLYLQRAVSEGRL